MNPLEDAKYYFAKVMSAGEKVGIAANNRQSKQFMLLFLALDRQTKKEFLEWADGEGHNSFVLNVLRELADHAYAMKMIEHPPTIGHKIF